MKYMATFLLLFALAASTAMAQIPSFINYQGLARDASGAALASKLITLRISVREGDAMGPVRFSETHRIVTDDLGVFSLQMGDGENRTASLTDLAWGSAQHWLQVEIDEQGGENFQLLGSSQMLSVPYALYAMKAGALDKSETQNAQGGVPSNTWHINGNTTTDPNVNFVGTTDDVGLSFRTNNVERMRITEDGKLGIGTSNPLSTLAIAGNLAVGVGYASTYPAPVNGAIIEGQVGIGTPSPVSKTDVAGNLTVGSGYAGTNAAPANGALVQGALGLGTTTPMNKLDVEGNAAIGSAYSGNVAAPANGALVQGALGLGTTTPMNKLDVEGNLAVGSEYSGNFAAPTGGAIIAGSVGIGTEAPTAKLDVNGNIRVRGDAAIEGTATIGGPLNLTSTIESTSPTTGALVVAGGVGIGKNINVGGSSNVAGNGLVSGRMGVGTSYTNVKMNVSAPSSMDYPIYAEVSGTSNKFYMNKEGQLYLKSTKAGSSSNTGNYAMHIDGQDQGLIIRLNNDSHPDSDNHYISFWGSTNVVRGRIEGLTQSELYNSFEYIWHDVMQGLDEAFVLAEGIATAAQADLAEVVVMAVEGAVAYAQWVEWLVEMENTVGIAFESGSGDYAEWLEKADPAEQFTFGDIVGVRGGKISRNTAGADQLMVVSMAPIVIGNMPEKGKEANYEKVAFIGQVPVKVKGAVHVGDYILASGGNDGTGYAVSPDNMQIADYAKVVGVAWSDASSMSGASYVRAAVGLNNNALVSQLTAQQKEIDQLKQTLQSVMAFVGMKEEGVTGEVAGMRKIATESTPVTTVMKPAISEPVAQNTVLPSRTSELATAAKAMKSERIRKLIEGKPDLILEGLDRVKQHFVQKGVDINANPELRRLFNDRNFFLEQAQKVAVSK